MLQFNLMQIFLVSPVIFGIGYKFPKKNMEFYNYLAVISVMSIFMIKFPNYSIEKWEHLDYLIMLYYILSPILFFLISYKKDNSPEYVYHLLKILGISLIAINSYLAVEKIIKLA